VFSAANSETYRLPFLTTIGIAALNFGSLNASWRLASLSNKFLLATNLVLGCAVLVLSGAALNNRDRITVLPPTIDKPMVVGWRNATPDYHKSMAMYFTGLIGTVGPKNIVYVLNVMEGFCSPEVAASFKTRMNAIASEYEFRNSTATTWFEGERVAWEEASGKVFVIGRLMSANAAHAITTKQAVYEYRIEIHEGQPLITYFDSYEGSLPHTLAWLQDPRNAEGNQSRVDREATKNREREQRLGQIEANKAELESKKAVKP